MDKKILTYITAATTVTALVLAGMYATQSEKVKKALEKLELLAKGYIP